MIVAVWFVYGTVRGTVGVKVGEYPYKDRNLADAHAKSVPNGYVMFQKIEKI